MSAGAVNLVALAVSLLGMLGLGIGVGFTMATLLLGRVGVHRRPASRRGNVIGERTPAGGILIRPPEPEQST